MTQENDSSYQTVEEKSSRRQSPFPALHVRARVSFADPMESGHASPDLHTPLHEAGTGATARGGGNLPCKHASASRVPWRLRGSRALALMPQPLQSFWDSVLLVAVRVVDELPVELLGLRKACPTPSSACSYPFSRKLPIKVSTASSACE